MPIHIIRGTCDGRIQVGVAKQNLESGGHNWRPIYRTYTLEYRIEVNEEQLLHLVRRAAESKRGESGLQSGAVRVRLEGATPRGEADLVPEGYDLIKPHRPRVMRKKR